MTRIIVGKNGRIVIPKHIRDQLNIEVESVLDAEVTTLERRVDDAKLVLTLTKIA